MSDKMELVHDIMAITCMGAFVLIVLCVLASSLITGI